MQHTFHTQFKTCYVCKPSFINSLMRFESNFKIMNHWQSFGPLEPVHAALAAEMRIQKATSCSFQVCSPN